MCGLTSSSVKVEDYNKGHNISVDTFHLSGDLFTLDFYQKGEKSGKNGHFSSDNSENRYW